MKNIVPRLYDGEKRPQTRFGLSTNFPIAAFSDRSTARIVENFHVAEWYNENNTVP